MRLCVRALGLERCQAAHQIRSSLRTLPIASISRPPLATVMASGVGCYRNRTICVVATGYYDWCAEKMRPVWDPPPSRIQEPINPGPHGEQST